MDKTDQIKEKNKNVTDEQEDVTSKQNYIYDNPTATHSTHRSSDTQNWWSTFSTWLFSSYPTTQQKKRRAERHILSLLFLLLSLLSFTVVYLISPLCLFFRGFCYFNSVAIAAKQLQHKLSVSKILIVDWVRWLVALLSCYSCVFTIVCTLKKTELEFLFSLFDCLLFSNPITRMFTMATEPRKCSTVTQASSTSHSIAMTMETSSLVAVHQLRWATLYHSPERTPSNAKRTKQRIFFDWLVALYECLVFFRV